MIRAALYTNKCDYLVLVHEIREMTAYYTNEYLKILNLFSSDDYETFIRVRESIDIICIDVSLEHGIEYAKLSRKLHPKSMIVVIADQRISPLTYMTPAIIATSLLLKPLREPMVKQAMRAVFGCFIMQEKTEEDIFLIETQEGRQKIPYSQILYFESKQKKVYACTRQYRYAFYGTLSALELEHAEQFIRCHRSFVVNRKKIEQVKISRNYLVLETGIRVPLSRSYKSAIKRYFYNK